MSHISFDSNDIQDGADARRILQGVEDAIYNMCIYNSDKAKLTIREGFTLEDFVNAIAIGLLGDYSKWDCVQRNKQKEEA